MQFFILPASDAWEKKKGRDSIPRNYQERKTWERKTAWRVERQAEVKRENIPDKKQWWVVAMTRQKCTEFISPPVLGGCGSCIRGGWRSDRYGRWVYPCLLPEGKRRNHSKFKRACSFGLACAFRRGRALQGFTSSALVPNTVALPIPNAGDKNYIKR